MKRIKRLFQKIFHGIEYIFVILGYFCCFPIAYLIYKRKHIWLISEIGFDARDNGYHFFKYLNENQKQIYSVYLISKNNSKYNELTKLGRTIKPCSFKHFLIFIAADVKASSNVFGCSPNSYLTKYLLKHHGTGVNVALKHGIFKNLHPNYFKKNAHLDLICCGAKPEFEFVDKNFGYNEGVAKYTGLARFDALHNFECKNEIFVMPTWRRWLDGASIEEFQKSDYFNSWNNFLNNKNLQQILDKNCLNLVFFVHPKLNKYISLYQINNKNISFMNVDEGDDIQSHLKSAKILITDFSSVYFDFAYMRKPSLYFQFDEEMFNAKHYEQGYFDYRENGFGPVSKTEDELLSNLNQIIKNNYSLDEKYKNRINDFFVLSDSQNSERIYEAIIEKLKH